MPIREYKCEKCGQVFEKIEKVSRAFRSCPTCGEFSYPVVSAVARTAKQWEV